jgi:hypothetical protein
MKKVAIFLAAIALTTGVFAQVAPQAPTEWFNQQAQTGGVQWGPNDTPESTTGIRRDRAPLAPATLLLLGLGGAVVGTKVVRNRKK